MYIYVHIYMYIYIYIIYIHVYVYIYTQLFMYIHIRASGWDASARAVTRYSVSDSDPTCHRVEGLESERRGV